MDQSKERRGLKPLRLKVVLQNQTQICKSMSCCGIEDTGIEHPDAPILHTFAADQSAQALAQLALGDHDLGNEAMRRSRSI